MKWAALVAALGLVACGKGDDGGSDKARASEAPKGCGLSAGAVAGWLTTQRLGVDLGGNPTGERKTAGEINEALVGLAGFAPWCDAGSRIPEACLTVSNASKPECQGPLEALGDLRVTGAACVAELGEQGVLWLADAELGARPDGDAAAYDAKVALLRGRLAGAPLDEICTDVDGIPLDCFGGAKHEACARIVDRLRGAMMPATPEPPTPAATVDAGAT